MITEMTTVLQRKTDVKQYQKSQFRNKQNRVPSIPETKLSNINF